MQLLMEKGSAFFQNMSGDQMCALFLVIIAVWIGHSVVQKGLSTLCTVFGVLAALYFVAPDLYAIAIRFLMKGLQMVSSGIQ